MSPATDPIGAPGDPDVAEPARAGGAHAGADSAGVPWAGRSFDPNPHAADDGRAPEALAAAIRRFRAGDGGQGDVVAEFGRSRLLIPLLAELGDGGAEVGAHGLSVDKSQELSIVTVEGPDGRRVLPVFASVDAMARWNPAARPVPADGVRVALAAADDGTDLVVLDPGSDGRVRAAPARGVGGRAIAARGIRRSIRPTCATRSNARSAPSSPCSASTSKPATPTPDWRGPSSSSGSTLVAGLTRAELDAVLQRLAARWAADDAIATLVDSLTVRLVST